MCRHVLGTMPTARAIAWTPSGSPLRPRWRRMATARVTAGTWRTRAGAGRAGATTPGPRPPRSASAFEPPAAGRLGATRRSATATQPPALMALSLYNERGALTTVRAGWSHARAASRGARTMSRLTDYTTY